MSRTCFAVRVVAGEVIGNPAGHVDVAVWAGPNSASWGKAGQLRLHPGEAGDLIGALTNYQLDTAEPGDRIRLDSVAGLSFGCDATLVPAGGGGAYECVRDEEHRGQHLALDPEAPDRVTAVWLAARVAS